MTSPSTFGFSSGQVDPKGGTGALVQALIRLYEELGGDLRLNEPRYASLPSILKAKKKPIERIDFKQLDVAIEPRNVQLELSSGMRVQSGLDLAG